MKSKKRNVRIAIEAHALSRDKITGVGKVVLHYITELQKLDHENSYYIYSIDNLKHVKINNPNWQTVSFDYIIKNLRVWIRNRWLSLKEKNGKTLSLFQKAQLVLLRAAKIIFELVDDIVFTWKLAKSLKVNNVDIYLASSTYYFPYFFFSDVKRAGIVYDLVWKYYPETMELGNRLRMSLFTRRNMNRLDLLISISDNTKKDVENLPGMNTRVVSIPLAADRSLFYKADKEAVTRIKEKYKISKQYIISVSTLEPRKNLEALLQAFSEMHGREDYHLLLVGMTGWIGGGFFSWLNETDIIKDIILTGYVPDEDLAPLYSGASLFVFPSLYEGFGLPVLEAMQCGCPVIASNSSSIPEVAGDAAVMVDAEDRKALSKAMGDILQESETLRALSEKGLKRSENFSWEKAASQLRDVLTDLMKT